MSAQRRLYELIRDLEDLTGEVEEHELRVEQMKEEKAGAWGPALDKAANDAVGKIIDQVRWWINDSELTAAQKLHEIDKHFYRLHCRIGDGKQAV